MVTSASCPVVYHRLKDGIRRARKHGVTTWIVRKEAHGPLFLAMAAWTHGGKRRAGVLGMVSGSSRQSVVILWRQVSIPDTASLVALMRATNGRPADQLNNGERKGHRNESASGYQFCWSNRWSHSGGGLWRKTRLSLAAICLSIKSLRSKAKSIGDGMAGIQNIYLVNDRLIDVSTCYLRPTLFETHSSSEFVSLIGPWAGRLPAVTAGLFSLTYFGAISLLPVNTGSRIFSSPRSKRRWLFSVFSHLYPALGSCWHKQNQDRGFLQVAF